ncbi:MAG TPA: non-heme iron oxygenase ferredoxin subunit [Kineosporiaceae bacterium]
MSAQVAARLAELKEGEPVRVVLSGVPVALVLTDDAEVHAVGDTCTHADVSLAEGLVDGCTIECWLHGSAFDLRTGQPLALPAIRPVPVFPVTIAGDEVLVDVTTTLGEAPAPAASRVDPSAKES